MKIIKEINHNEAIVSVIGTINTETANELDEQLHSLDASTLNLILDFSQTNYITSAGLRVLLINRKRFPEDKMHIINVNENIADVFDMTGFSSVLAYERALNTGTNENINFKQSLELKMKQNTFKPIFFYLGREYTWEDIEKASHIVANDLHKKGVKRGSHVGICAMNSINWIISFFAVQKLGAIAVLLNPGLKAIEMITLSKIADITHLCYGKIPGTTDFELISQAVTTSDSIISQTYDISSDIDFTKRYNEYDAIKDKFREEYDADDPSVIIFTSGSTGVPKAVVLSARNLFKLGRTVIASLNLRPEDRNCGFLPLFHIFGLHTGIIVSCIVDSASYIPESSSTSALLDTIDKNNCTIFFTVPTMMLAITQNPNFTSERVSSLRLSVLGGSLTTEEQFLFLKKLMPNNHLVNIYGMSEISTISVTDYEDTVEHITQTVGKIIKGVDCIIRDVQTGEILPQGKSGEICIRSNNMFVCYYKLPIDSQPIDENGWMGTGDLGYIDDDGYLRLTGRAKELIIRGGENISPNEIASTISEIAEIADVKVLGIPHKILGEQVAAAIIMKEGSAFSEDAIKTYLADKLAKYKIPEHFEVFESFPLLGSGKVDAISLKKIMIEKVSNH